MDQSTENVKLYAVFLQNVLTMFKDKPDDYEKLVELAEGYHINEPTAFVPIEVYNNMCNWIEDNIGPVNTKKLGRKIGDTIFTAMRDAKLIQEKPTPMEAMQGLVKIATISVKDPKKRGYVILESSEKHIVIRRTQTFNGVLACGAIDEIIRRTGVTFPKTDYQKSVALGDEFDDYKISWI